MVETHIDEIINEFEASFPQKEQGVARSIVEYVDILHRIYGKGAKELCFCRLNETLSSDFFDVCRSPIDDYFKPAFNALGCEHIYREFLEWGIANIINEKSK